MVSNSGDGAWYWQFNVLWYLHIMYISYGRASVTTTCCWCCWLDTALRSYCSCNATAVHCSVVVTRAPHPALSVHLAPQTKDSKTEKQEYRYYFIISLLYGLYSKNGLKIQDHFWKLPNKSFNLAQRLSSSNSTPDFRMTSGWLQED